MDLDGHKYVLKASGLRSATRNDRCIASYFKSNFLAPNSGKQGWPMRDQFFSFSSLETHYFKRDLLELFFKNYPEQPPK